MNLNLATLLLAFTLTNCSDNEEQIQSELNLDGMQIELNIDFSKAKYNVNDGIENLASELTEYIYAEDEELDTRISDIQFRRAAENIYINYPEKELIEIFSKTSHTRRDAFLAADPCETESKTCRNRSCVESTLKEILGDGSRDVNIEYRRNTFSVTIKWTYQDC